MTSTRCTSCATASFSGQTGDERGPPAPKRTARRTDPDGRPVPVLVLRRSLGDLQHGVLAVARTLGRLGVPVYATTRSWMEPATKTRYITGKLDLSAGASDEEWIDQLMGSTRS